MNVSQQSLVCILYLWQLGKSFEFSFQDGSLKYILQSSPQNLFF